MKLIVFLLVAVVLSTGYAVHLYVRDERRHRARWRAEPPPSSAEPPYRRVPPEADAGKAPALVRFTAFACLCLGPVATVFMLLPAVFFSRGVRTLASAEPSGLLHGSLLVQRLGSLLLARDERAMQAIDAISPLLRILTLPLLFFSGMFVLAEKGPPPFWWTIFGLGGCFAALLGLLGMTSPRWSEAAPTVDAAAMDAEDEPGPET